MKYPKLQTLYKRDENRNFVIMPEQLSKPEFDLIKYWDVSEKIDGTNIRVIFELLDVSYGYSVTFKGRTDDADIPKYLLQELESMFSVSLLKYVFPGATKVILFGEGYGAKIQAAGKNYSEQHSFVLFDAWVNGWWLEQSNIVDIAKTLGIKSVPSFGIMTQEEIVSFVKSMPKSVFAKEDMVMEGVVVRSAPLVLFRDGTPVMFKLKCSDFVKFENKKRKV